MCGLNPENYVIEHVLSRPKGNNSYRNLVAACRECNNRKNDSEVADFLRTLYRESFLSVAEMKERLGKLDQLKNGILRPVIQPN
ncbi:MAG: HNH endonuclease [Verrucomicrobia bacterium]|nr:HNH endonuclease [Verrucomicrobiota bacterium]